MNAPRGARLRGRPPQSFPARVRALLDRRRPPAAAPPDVTDVLTALLMGVLDEGLPQAPHVVLWCTTCDAVVRTCACPGPHAVGTVVACYRCTATGGRPAEEPV
jgi:hypothetical protein